MAWTAAPPTARWSAWPNNALGSAQVWPLCLLTALGSSTQPVGGEPASLGTQSLPRELELAASKIADSTAFDHLGGAYGRDVPLSASRCRMDATCSMGRLAAWRAPYHEHGPAVDQWKRRPDQMRPRARGLGCHARCTRHLSLCFPFSTQPCSQGPEWCRRRQFAPFFPLGFPVLVAADVCTVYMLRHITSSMWSKF